MNDEILKKIPTALRWVLFFPTAILGMLVGTFLWNTAAGWGMTSQGVDPESFWSLFLINTSGSAISAFCFVYSGAFVAPESKKTISICLGVFAMILGLTLLLWSILRGDSGIGWIIVAELSFMVGAGLGIYACHPDRSN